MKNKTKVVHINKQAFDVYIGRGCYGRDESIWHNPFKLDRDTKFGRIEVLEKYVDYLANHPELLDRVHELRGKTLGCWCAPKMCHGDVLAHLADAEDAHIEIQVIQKEIEERREKKNRAVTVALFPMYGGPK